VVSTVVSSSNGDPTQYIDVAPATGVITRNLLTPKTNTSQTYTFSVIDTATAQESNSVNVTFDFITCVIQLSGPANGTTICPGFPPDTATGTYDLFPQLTLTASGIPDGVEVQWDVPKDCNCPAGYNGLGATLADLGTKTEGGAPIYSPDIVTPGTSNFIYVSNYNGILNIPASSHTGIYGTSNYGGSPTPLTYGNCQLLRFSVTPKATSSPYITGSKVIQVCTDANAACSIL